MEWNGTPEYRALMKIVEPYQYRQRLTMPKFIVNASGDQFFLPDSSQFYFNDLPGVKYLRYVPNADHSLKGSDAYETLQACYSAVLNHSPLPQFSWTLEKDGAIRVTTKDTPTEVKLWQATNPDARDFRLEMIGPAYKSTHAHRSGRRRLCREGPRAGQGLDGVLCRADFPERQLVPALQVHDPGPRGARRAAPQVRAQRAAAVEREARGPGVPACSVGWSPAARAGGV